MSVTIDLPRFFLESDAAATERVAVTRG